MQKTKFYIVKLKTGKTELLTENEIKTYSEIILEIVREQINTHPFYATITPNI